ncbi:MAG TPA: PAS domain-containing protein, partial [Blastocatellia bacterium]|nr:PAS domain-containing protein [Blastocatellia bacterium]
MTTAKKTVRIGNSASQQLRLLLIGNAAEDCAQILPDCALQVIGQEELWSHLDQTMTEYDGVLLTLTEPDDTVQLCRQLRADTGVGELPIIALVADSAEAERAIQAGASDFCLAANAAAELAVRLHLCLLNHQHAQSVAWQLDEQRREITLSHLLMEKVVDALPVSLYVVDRDLHIVAWNRNREIGGQGIERQQAIGRSVLDVFSKMPRQRLRREFEQTFATGELLRFEQESTLDGNTRHWFISKIPMRLDEASDAVTHVITV